MLKDLKFCPLFGKLHNIVSQMRNRHAWPTVLYFFIQPINLLNTIRPKYGVIEEPENA